MWVRQDAELEEVNANGVERTRSGQRLDSGAVVGVNEELAPFDPGTLLERCQEAPPLFRSERCIVVGAGEMGQHARESQRGQRCANEPQISLERRDQFRPNNATDAGATSWQPPNTV